MEMFPPVKSLFIFNHDKSRPFYSKLHAVSLQHEVVYIHWFQHINIEYYPVK